MSVGAYIVISALIIGNLLHTLMYQSLSRRIRALEERRNRTGEGWS